MTLPAVCFVEDVCRALRVSRRTFKRLLRHGVFAVPELPKLDRRHRWSGAAVEAFIESGANQSVTVLAHRATVNRPTRNRPRNRHARKSLDLQIGGGR